jgi:hypothetical protein
LFNKLAKRSEIDVALIFVIDRAVQYNCHVHAEVAFGKFEGIPKFNDIHENISLVVGQGGQTRNGCHGFPLLLFSFGSPTEHRHLNFLKITIANNYL